MRPKVSTPSSSPISFRALAREAEYRAVALTFLARDSIRAQNFIDALAFAAPEIEALLFPAWDCQPTTASRPTPP